MVRRRLANARILVTGASSGIGRALAVELARRGAQLLLTARRQERLAELAAQLEASGSEAAMVAGDLTDPAVRGALLDHAARRWGALDGLVNNAGVGAVGPFREASPERLRQIMELNFFAPAELTRGALPLLRQGNSPLVTNIGSVLGHLAVPNKSEYCASKFALRGWTEALRLELAEFQIDVLLVSPSTTGSEFFERLIEGQATGRAARAMTPQQVARAVARAMTRGRAELILPASARWLVWAHRMAPSVMRWALGRWG